MPHRTPQPRASSRVARLANSPAGGARDLRQSSPNHPRADPRGGSCARGRMVDGPESYESSQASVWLYTVLKFLFGEIGGEAVGFCREIPKVTFLVSRCKAALQKHSPIMPENTCISAYLLLHFAYFPSRVHVHLQINVNAIYNRVISQSVSHFISRSHPALTPPPALNRAPPLPFNHKYRVLCTRVIAYS